MIILIIKQANLKTPDKKANMQPQCSYIQSKTHEDGLNQNLPQNTSIINQRRQVQSGINQRKNPNMMMEQQPLPTMQGQWKKISNINPLTTENINIGTHNQASNEIKGENVGVIFNRINHCSFFYKNCIYYYGGMQATPQNIQAYSKSLNQILKQRQIQRLHPSQVNSQKVPQLLSSNTPSSSSAASTQRKQSLWNSFHKYNIVTKEYSRHYLNIGTNFNLFNNISSFGYYISNNILYIFGGMNYETLSLRSSQMCSINLQSGQIKRYQSKTSISSIPSGRLNPLVTAIQKFILLLFGGEVLNQSTNTYSYINDMYTFKAQTKTWTKIQDNLHIKYPIVSRPWLVNFGDNCIYLLGGKRQILRNQGNSSQYIDNTSMYRLKILTKTVSYRADCCMRQIINTNPIPHNQTYMKVIKYGDRGLFVFTTDSDSQNLGVNTYIWYYDQYNAAWTQIKHSNKNIGEVVMRCGGGQDYSLGVEKILTVQNNQIYSFDFSNICLQSFIKETISYKKRALCSLCEEQKIHNYDNRYTIPAEYYEEFCSALEFPFAAIGILVDNTVLARAKNCSIYFNVGYMGRQLASSTNTQKQKQNFKTKYMIIEDNGYPCCIWSPQMKQSQFINVISNYSTNTSTQQLMESEDNKVLIERCLKQIQEKQKNLQKQFLQFQKNQSKLNANGNGANNQNVPQNYTSSYNTYGNHSHTNFKTQKDFQRQQHQYIEKKQRLQHKEKMIEIQQKCRKFCNNLKLAGIKLGQCIIYACKQKKDEDNAQYNPIDKQIRRFFFMRKEKNTQTNKQNYVCYAYITENNTITEPKMQATFKFVSKEFKKQLKIVTDRLKTMNNVVLITDLRNISSMDDNNNSEKSIPIGQMRLKKKQNDVFYGQNTILNYLQANNVQKMTQCCDISLKTYLSLLYLSSEQLNINLYLSVRQSPSQYINTQPFLPTIDKLNSKKFIQVSKSLDFSDQCNVVEVYWYPQYAAHNDNIATKINNLGFLLNGILIYHKGRLISRFNINLGQLLDKIQLYPKYGSMFGYLQIKEEYGANLYSTDVFYPRTFEKYFARINFVSQFMETKYNAKPVRSRGDDHHSSGYQRITKRSKHQ